jgi:superfamily I DNA and/or RNA helicase
MDALLQQNSLWVEHRLKLDSAVENYGIAKNEGGEILGLAQRELGYAKRQFDKIELECTTKILSDADVVVTTCIGAGSEILRSFVRTENIEFRSVLIDEAAQCMVMTFFSLF